MSSSRLSLPSPSLSRRLKTSSAFAGSFLPTGPALNSSRVIALSLLLSLFLKNSAGSRFGLSPLASGAAGLASSAMANVPAIASAAKVVMTSFIESWYLCLLFRFSAAAWAVVHSNAPKTRKSRRYSISDPARLGGSVVAIDFIPYRAEVEVPRYAQRRLLALLLRRQCSRIVARADRPAACLCGTSSRLREGHQAAARIDVREVPRQGQSKGRLLARDARSILERRRDRPRRGRRQKQRELRRRTHRGG